MIYGMIERKNTERNLKILHVIAQQKSGSPKLLARPYSVAIRKRMSSKSCDGNKMAPDQLLLHEALSYQN